MEPTVEACGDASSESLDPYPACRVTAGFDCADELSPAVKSSEEALGDSSDAWPDPVAVFGALPGVEPFKMELLPPSFLKWGEDIADRMQVPIDYVAAAIVTCLAGAVNRRAMIQPKVHDSGWKVVPNLWGAIVGRPGFKKSPVIESVLRPLKLIQDKFFKDHEAAELEYQIESERYDLQINAWKQQATQSYKRREAEPERPSNIPPAPVCKRLIVADATFEALHQKMQQNPEGVFVLRDELAGWFAQLDKPGRECERAFCLETWSGNSGFTMDRIGRGTIHAEHVCMSLFGGIQPGRLRSYMTGALEAGASDDGLIQRIQVLVYPDHSPKWSLVDRPPNADAEKVVLAVFEKLVAISANPPTVFGFQHDAQELFFAWYSDLQKKVRGGSLNDALASHLTKYASLMPSMALLFELADQAATGKFTSNVVSLEHAKQAAAWCSYLESHARRVYSVVASPQMRAAKDLGEHIKRSDVGRDGTLALRDVYRMEWTGLETPPAAKAAFDILEDLGWAREIQSDRSRRPGRPPGARYQINPKVRA